MLAYGQAFKFRCLKIPLGRMSVIIRMRLIDHRGRKKVQEEHTKKKKYVQDETKEQNILDMIFLSDVRFGNLSSAESNLTFELNDHESEYPNKTLGYDQEEGPVDECKHLDEHGWSHVVFCVEEWPFGEDSLDGNGRLYYTLITFSLQLVVPLILISFCYFRIYCKLSKQEIVRRSLLNLHDAERLRRTEMRCKRRNQKMLAISLVYLISWFPLGIISILLDYNPLIFGSNTAHVAAIFVTCHLVGMLSASLNPVIYGYKNKEVRKGNLKHIFFLSFKIYAI